MQGNRAIDLPATGDPGRFEEAHRALLADRSIQLELPGPKPLPEGGGVFEWLIRLLVDGGGGLRVVRWVALAAIVLLLLYLLFRWLDTIGMFGRGGQGSGAAEGADWRPAEAPARALLEEADRLAAAGRYAEAAHLLLFRSIEDIDARKPDLVRPALTSRDIAGAPAIPARPRRAFAEIVAMVERSLFGGRSLDAGDWTRCRAAYEEFAFAAEWGR